MIVAPVEPEPIETVISTENDDELAQEFDKLFASDAELQQLLSGTDVDQLTVEEKTSIL